MLPIVPIPRVATMSLTGTPTALATVVPAGLSPVSVRGVSTAAWTYRGVGDATGFPVAANEVVEMPFSAMSEVLVAGSATLTLVFMGHPR